MAIFRPTTSRSPQRLRGLAWRNKVLGVSADEPDNADTSNAYVPNDAEEADDFDESHNVHDPDNFLITSWSICSGCKS